MTKQELLNIIKTQEAEKERHPELNEYLEGYIAGIKAMLKFGNYEVKNK